MLKKQDGVSYGTKENDHKMKTAGKVLIIGGVLAGIAGIGYTVLYLMKQASLLQDYEISVAKVEIKKISFTRFSLILFLKFWNKSNLSIDILSQKYKVYLNGVQIVELENDKPVTIEPRAKTIIPLNVTFDLSKVLKLTVSNLRAILKDKNKIKIRTMGSIQVKSSFLFVNNFPVDFTYTLQELLDLAKEK